MGKNKTGIMAAISAAAGTPAQNTGTDRANRTLPKGTIGSVRAGLGGIQEIDTNLILGWGPKDRLDLELTAVNTDPMSDSIKDLADSIAQSGQQVPVLLRPSKDRDGQFEIIYGQRRVVACRYLGIPVRALIRTLDDTDALMAKGLENAGRAELSFYERVRFAQAILDQGYNRAQVCQALAISKHSLSQLERINRFVPTDVGDAIGAAPAAGRPKWTVLARAFETGQLSENQALSMLQQGSPELSSDDRLEQILRELSKRGARPPVDAERKPMAGVSIKSGKSALSVSIKRTGETARFAAWMDQNLDQLIQDSFERFRSENQKD